MEVWRCLSLYIGMKRSPSSHALMAVQGNVSVSFGLYMEVRVSVSGLCLTRMLASLNPCFEMRDSNWACLTIEGVCERLCRCVRGHVLK